MNWEVIPGLGEQYLQTISSEVVRWNFWAGHVEQSADQLEELDNTAIEIVEETAEQSMADDSFNSYEDLGQRFDAAQDRAIRRAFLARIATKRLAALDQSPNLGLSQRAQLTVIKSGVQGKKYLMNARKKGDKLTEMPQLEIAEEIAVEGYIGTLHSQPKLGGLLVVSREWSSTYIRGLVHPLTGEPRVKLDIVKRVWD